MSTVYVQVLLVDGEPAVVRITPIRDLAVEDIARQQWQLMHAETADDEETAARAAREWCRDMGESGGVEDVLAALLSIASIASRYDATLAHPSARYLSRGRALDRIAATYDLARGYGETDEELRARVDAYRTRLQGSSHVNLLDFGSLVSVFNEGRVQREVPQRLGTASLGGTAPFVPGATAYLLCLMQNGLPVRVVFYTEDQMRSLTVGMWTFIAQAEGRDFADAKRGLMEYGWMEGTEADIALTLGGAVAAAAVKACKTGEDVAITSSDLVGAMSPDRRAEIVAALAQHRDGLEHMAVAVDKALADGAGAHWLEAATLRARLREVERHTDEPSMLLCGVPVYVSGVAGHFADADQCTLRICWRIGDWRVSTVAGYRLRGAGQVEVGAGRCSETCVFRVCSVDGKPEGEVVDWSEVFMDWANEHADTRRAEEYHHRIAVQVARHVDASPEQLATLLKEVPR